MATQKKVNVSEVTASSMGLTTINDELFGIAHKYYTENKSHEDKAVTIGDLRKAVALQLVDQKGYSTPEHFISPNTTESKSKLSKVEYSDLLNMFSSFLGDTYKGLLPKGLANGIMFTLGTEDKDDYSKNDPKRKAIINAGRQPATILGDFKKIAMALVTERAKEAMTDDEKVEAEANSDHIQVVESWNKFVKLLEKKKSGTFVSSIAKECHTITNKLTASASDTFEPSH
jgi:hypothetical protein